MKKILITGGAGYIGSHVAEILIKNKNKVIIVDNLSTGFKKLINKKAKFFKININNTKKIREVIVNNKINSIIHLAAALSVGESEKNPNKYYKINVKYLFHYRRCKVPITIKTRDMNSRNINIAKTLF